MKILLVQLSFLGDVVLSTPVIRLISEKHPNAEIFFLATKLGAELVRHDPLIKEVIIYDKRGSDSGISGLFKMAKLLESYNFNLVYNLHRSMRTTILLFLAKIPIRIGFAAAAGSLLFSKRINRPQHLHEVDRNLSIIADPDKIPTELKELRLFCSSNKKEYNSNYIVMFPSSTWKTKMWFTEGYRAAAKSFIEKGFDIILLGSSQEVENNLTVSNELPIKNLTGFTSLDETIQIVKGAKAVVCNDSLGLHIASACKTPTVALFCSTSPMFGFGPWQNRAIVIEEEYLSCKPCRRHGSMSCPVGTDACMHVSPQRVISALEELCQ